VTIDRSTLVEAVRTCACFNLRRASRAVTRLFDEALDRGGLRSTGFVALVAIRLEGAPTLPRLATVLGVDRSTLTRNLRPLVTSGLVKTAPSRGGRTVTARLTPRGEKALARCVPLWREAQRHVESRVGRGGWEGMLGMLSAVCAIAPRRTAPG
jgi:DNA-binding MarR family transcriptional regulator